MCTTQVVLQEEERRVCLWVVHQLVEVEIFRRFLRQPPSHQQQHQRHRCPQQGAELRALLATAGLLETQSTTGVQAVSQTTTARDTEAARGAMAPVTAPTVELTPELRRGAQSFSNNFSIAMDDVLADGDLSKMKPDQMLAAFFKLNIEDPNNSVETHNRLSEVMSELRQRAIDDAKAKIAEAEKMREEAEKYAV